MPDAMADLCSGMRKYVRNRRTMYCDLPVYSH